MNPKLAANRLIDIVGARAEKDPLGESVGHARWMLEGISAGYIQHEKAHRWLGYAQAILVLAGETTLDEMKEVNRKSAL